RPWDFKHGAGGLVDVEFITQYLVLRHAASHPQVLQPGTSAALSALAEAGLLAQADAATLLAAGRLWRRLQGIQRLTVGERIDEAALPEGFKRTLAAAGEAPDFAGLKAKVAESAAAVRRLFEQIIEAPAVAALSAQPDTSKEGAPA